MDSDGQIAIKPNMVKEIASVPIALYWPRWRRYIFRLILIYLGAIKLKGFKGLRFSFERYMNDEIARQVKEVAEMERLFPIEAMMRNYCGKKKDGCIKYKDQIRYYTVYRYLKKYYPGIFDQDNKVLDAGDTCGIMLRSLGKNGTSLNIDSDKIQALQTGGLKAVCGDLENLDLPDNAFDYVLCFQTIEHLLNPIKALNELGRVAGKYVFVSIPFTLQTIVNRAPQGRDLYEHVFEFSTEDFRSILSFTCLEYVASFPIYSFFRNTVERKLFGEYLGPEVNFFVLKKRAE